MSKVDCQKNKYPQWEKDMDALVCHGISAMADVALAGHAQLVQCLPVDCGREYVLTVESGGRVESFRAKKRDGMTAWTGMIDDAIAWVRAECVGQ